MSVVRGGRTVKGRGRTAEEDLELSDEWRKRDRWRKYPKLYR